MVERSQRALTLTELLFALVLLGILGSLALPGMAAWLDGNRQRSVLHELSASIQLGRTHAVAYQRPVTLCPSTDGRHCGSDWERAGCLRKTVGNGFSWDARLQRRKGSAGTVRTASGSSPAASSTFTTGGFCSAEGIPLPGN